MFEIFEQLYYLETLSMKLTLEALQVLDAIDRQGSFAAAAAALYRVPSTVTYTVQKLEDDLGFIIFRREGRRSMLTPAGSLLLERGRELLLAAEQIVESAHQVNSGWESTLNIAIDTVWDINQFYPTLAQFQRLNSGVQVNLSSEVMGGSLEALIEGRADLVIGGPPPVSGNQGIKFKQIFTAQWLFVVARNHPLTKVQLPLSETDIKAYTSVTIKDSSKNAPIMAHRIFDKQDTLRVASLDHKIMALVQGIGVGFCPKHRIQQQLDSGQLVALEIAKPATDSPHYCSWRTNNKGKAMRWFVDKILQQTQN